MRGAWAPAYRRTSARSPPSTDYALVVRRSPDSADAMLVFANVLWSLNYATTKYAFGEWLPLAFSATRFLCAGIIFALFVLWREGSLRIRRSDVKLVVATAAVGILLNQLTFNYA